MMNEESVKASKGILLMRSKSGTAKIEKVIVQAKPGARKSEVKCRFFKFEPSKVEKNCGDYLFEFDKIRPLVSQPSVIVMSQVKSYKSEDVKSENSASYIDSGLRPLRSDESRLKLTPSHYKDKKEAKVSEDEEVKPLLDDISSNVFVKKAEIKEVETASKPSSGTPSSNVTSSEEDSTPIPSIIKPGPLKNLEEAEETTFTIKMEKQEIKEDFCLHAKDPPEHLLGDFSTSTFEDLLVKQEDNLIMSQNKGDFCLHNPISLKNEDFETSSSAEKLHLLGDFSTSTFEDLLMKQEDNLILSQNKGAFCLHNSKSLKNEDFETSSSAEKLTKQVGFQSEASSSSVKILSSKVRRRSIGND